MRMPVYIFIIVSIMITGCHCGNLEEYEKGNISVSGFNFLGWGYANYGSFSIGTSEEPFYQSYPMFIIILPDGKALKSTQFSMENVQKIHGIRIEQKKEKKMIITDYMLSYGEYPYSGYAHFHFIDSKIISFNCLCYCPWLDLNREKINMKIGTIDGKKLYKMPLKYWQIKELFGAPDLTNVRWTP